MNCLESWREKIITEPQPERIKIFGGRPPIEAAFISNEKGIFVSLNVPFEEYDDPHIQHGAFNYIWKKFIGERNKYDLSEETTLVCLPQIPELDEKTSHTLLKIEQPIPCKTADALENMKKHPSNYQGFMRPIVSFLINSQGN